MELKSKKIAALLTVALAASAASAKEYPIPATQAEFDAQWTIVPGEDGNTWTWVDDTTPYAKTPSATDGIKGPSLILAEPIPMEAGDIYAIQAKVSSDDYNHDQKFYIVYGTDKENLKTMDVSGNVYNPNRDGTVGWQTKSTSPSELTITEPGDYYIGIRSFKPAYSTTGELFVASLYAEKSVDYPQKVTGGKAVTLEGKLGATVTWTWPTKTKSGAAIDEELSANIYRSTSDSKADLYKEENIVGRVTGGVAGAAGEFVDDPETSLIPVTEPGKYYYYVAPANAAGENSECASSSVITCKWVGEEIKFQPILNSSYYPATAAMIDENSVEINFIPRIEPVNGGWYDESQVYLKVTRQFGTDEPVVVTETAPMVSPFVDNTLSEPGIYTYNLYVVYKGNESTATKIDPIFAGGTVSLPFSEDFTESNSMSNFTVLYSNSSYKWNRASGGYVQLNSYTSGNSSTLATAPVRVEAGKTYHISCVAWKGNTSTDKTLEIVEGKKASAQSDFSTIKSFDIATTSSDRQTYEVFYSPEESGIHYFGFKADASSNYIYLDDILIEETTPSPAAVADLTAVPDEKGALSAHITFTIPSTTNAGNPLTGLDKVVVTRVYGENTETVKTIDGDECVPGAQVEFDDAVPEAGMYAYEVVSAMDGNLSDKVATVAAWVGYDIPKGVTGFSIRAELNDKGGADVSWSALSSTVPGTHGGYVDTENLRYRIYRVPQLFGEEAVIAGETSEVTFADDGLVNAPWNKYQYAISVLNGPQEGALSTGNSVSGGIVDANEYNPDLTDEDFVEALDGRAFIYDNGALAFSNRGETEGNEYVAYFPAFKVNDTTGKKFKLDLSLSRGNADYEELLEVYLCTVEVTSPGTESENAPDTEAAVIAGSDNRTLLNTIPVHAMADAPAQEEVKFETAAEGRYRIALRCASADNKLLSIHGFTLVADNGSTDGIKDAVINNDGITFGAGGELLFPEDTAAYAVYRADGTLVASGNGAGNLALANGLYIVSMVKADGSTVAVKVVK